jgi:nucleotide-binding universal stress UspA family protein
MLPIRKILCPTDFSEPSGEGYKTALLLAKHFGAQLLVLHVSPPIPVMPMGEGAVHFNVKEYSLEIENYARSRLKEWISEAAVEEVTISGVLGEGDAAEEIVRAAESQDADLIVIATHGHSGWRKLVTGSVTEKVVRTSSRPVLTVRAP